MRVPVCQSYGFTTAEGSHGQSSFELERRIQVGDTGPGLSVLIAAGSVDCRLFRQPEQTCPAYGWSTQSRGWP